MAVAEPRAKSARALAREDAPTWRAAMRPTGMIWPAVVVLAGACAAWLTTGVTVGQVALFLGYEVAFVVAPGWLLYRAIRPAREGALRQLVFGWTLGYLVEILSFVATAAVGARALMSVVPPLVGVGALAVWRWRARNIADSEATRARPPPLSWTLAGICLLALLFGVI